MSKTEQPPKTEQFPESGRVDFADGDWVQFPTQPTHRQAKAVAKAVLLAAKAAESGSADALDCMAPTVAALIVAGKLTNAATNQAIPEPFTAESLDDLAEAKLTRLFSLALQVPDLLPNLPLPK